MPIEACRAIPLQHVAPSSSNILQGTDPRMPAAAVAAAILAMDPTVVRELTDAVARKQQAEAEGGEGRTGPAQIVQLPAAKMTVEQASQVLAGIVSRLPLLLGPAAMQDPIKTEDGATVRAAEAVATQSQGMARTDGPGVADNAADVTGVDQVVANESPNIGTFFKLSQFVNLLILLRDILLEIKAKERETSADMSTMKLNTTIFAGKMQVQAAVESFSASIASGLVGFGVGAASMKKTYESTTMQTRSADVNLGGANAANATTDGMRVGAKTHATPNSQLRPASNLDGTPVRVAKGADRSQAQVEGDLEANVSAMNQTGRHTGLEEGAPVKHERHGESMSESQKAMSQATLLNMMFPAVTGAIQSGGGIQSQTTTVVSDVAKQEADILGNAARTHQENVSNYGEFYDAIMQLFQSLLAMQDGTNQHIIQRA